MSYTQGAQPCEWFGTNQINTAPWFSKQPTFDIAPANIINHKIMTLGDNNESIGYGQPNIKFTGFLSSPTTSASPINASYPFTYGTGYLGRPIAVGWFTLDYNNPQPFFSTVGYGTSIHFEDAVEGRSVYKIPYAFGFVGTPYKVITTSTSDGQNYTLGSTSAVGSGYFVGVQVIGASSPTNYEIFTDNVNMAVTFYDVSASANAGSGPNLSCWTTFASVTTPSPSSIIIPLQDLNGKQSISSFGLTLAHTYKVQFANAFQTTYPTVNVLYINA